MHCDTLSELRNNRRKGSLETLRKNQFCLDLERMKRDGYVLQNFGVYVNLGQKDSGFADPFENAMDQVRVFRQEMEENQDICLPVASWREIEECRRQGKMAAMLTLEEGGMCMGEMEKLQAFYDAGARMMTLCWNYENELAYPAVYEPDPADGNIPEGVNSTGGLKKRGIEFLEEMERIGMIPDVSHLSDEGFWDLISNTHKPFAASHSNARTVHSNARNLTDEMLRAMGERGCMIGLNYYPVFLMKAGSSECASEMLAKHALHMVNKAGIESLGLGSDFDGFSAKSDIKDTADLENLTFALHRAGFTYDEIDMICAGNVLRFYRELL